MKLSDRIRPDVEAAPWVIDGIKALEERLAAIAAAPVASPPTGQYFAGLDHTGRPIYRSVEPAKPAPVADGVDWRALYRFQTAMRYMDADAKLTRDKAYAMADQDVAGLLAAQEKK